MASIIYFTNHATFFASHRLPIAKAAIDRGDKVLLVTGHESSLSMSCGVEEKIRSIGLDHIRLPFRSASKNIFLEVYTIFALMSLILKHKPDVVHCISPKGVLYGGAATFFSARSRSVFALSGLGYLFTDRSDTGLLIKLSRRIYSGILKLFFRKKNAHVIVQNSDDYQFVSQSLCINKNNISLIPGSGVDLDRFDIKICAIKENIVLFPARILVDKGAAEFAAAAKQLVKQFPSWRFVMAGAYDYQNPTSVPLDEIETWRGWGVELMGHVDNIEDMYRRSSIVCLPSYREGFPKSLIEAAAASCAIVTTDVTGCRDAVIDGKTGVLVPAKDYRSLILEIAALIGNRESRLSLGEEARAHAENYFSIKDVVAKHIKIYG